MARLQDSARTTLDGSGAGMLRFGPMLPGTRWEVKGVSVQVDPSTPGPVAKIYKGTPSPGTYISGTYDGANDSDNALSESLWPGEFITVQWTGGSPGATATVAYRGEIIAGA